FPKDITNSQSAPLYPVSQEHSSSSTHVPCDDKHWNEIGSFQNTQPIDIHFQCMQTHNYNDLVECMYLWMNIQMDHLNFSKKYSNFTCRIHTNTISLTNCWIRC